MVPCEAFDALRRDYELRAAGFQIVGLYKSTQLYEVKSTYILQPGPVILRGMRQMADAIAAWGSMGDGVH